MLRNCCNVKKLSNDARAVTAYSPRINAELARAGAKKVFVLGGIRLYECPVTYITQDSFDVSRIVYRSAGSGHLLLAGGWGDQPYWFVEAMDLFRIEQGRSTKES